MPYKDPLKKKQYRKEYYQRTKEKSQEYYIENKEKYKKRNKESRKRNKEYVNDYKIKNGGCARCGYNKHPCAIDFHHEDSKKENISRLVKSAASIETIEEEISKCILLCAICHREEHYT